MKKVLFVATVVKTHIMQFHIPYLHMLKDMGWATAVAARNDYDDPADCRIPDCDQFFPLPFERFPLHPGNWKAYRELKRIIDAEEFDMIHCHTPVGAALTRLAARKARKKGTKVLYTAHGFHFFRGAPFFQRIFSYLSERILSAYTDVLITINQEDYAIAQTFPAKRVEYVPGVGIDLRRFAFVRQEKDRFRTDLGLGADDFVLLTVGELIPRKNQTLVLEALGELSRQGKLTNLRYVICGQGTMAKKLQEQAAALDLQDRVVFLGYRRDMDRIYGAADAFVFMSLQEGLPIALTEAMASGLPCICSDVRGNRDLIRSEESGLMVPFSPQAVADAILRLKDDSQLCKKLGVAAAAAAQAYDLPAILARMKGIYLSVTEAEQPNE